MLCPTCGASYPPTARRCDLDGAELIEPKMPLALGALVDGRYRIDGVLGAGGMGVVYRATHVEMGRAAALKVLQADRSSTPEARARFQHEALAASRIAHPHIVTIYDFGQTDAGADYLAMEVLEGEELSTRLARGPLSRAEALTVLSQAADALAEAHEAGVVHRDLKPGNIFLRASRRPPDAVLLDFGVARVGPCPDTGEAGRFVGSPAYASPEQARGQAVDPRSDLYSLGVVAYECLTGRRPFEGSPKAVLLAHLNAPPPPFAQVAPAVDCPALEALTRTLLAKAPEDRPASAQAVVAQLAAIEASGCAPAVEPQPPAPRVPGWIWGVGVVVALLTVLAVVLTAGQTPAQSPAQPDARVCVGDPCPPTP